VAEAGEGTSRVQQADPGAAGHRDGTAACPKGEVEVLEEGAWVRDPAAFRDIHASEKDNITISL